MTTVIKKNKFRLSHHEGATKVALLCHGGWSFTNGYTLSPSGLIVKFYSVHGHFGTNSITIAESLFGKQTDVVLPASTIQRVMVGELSLEEATLQAKAELNSTGGAQAMVVDSVGGRMRTQLHNYSLSYHGPRDSERSTEQVWDAHVAGHYTEPVDLLCMQKNTNKTRSLAAALAFAQDKGGPYEEFHFLPCRYVAASDATSMLSVGEMPTFDGAFQTMDL